MSSPQNYFIVTFAEEEKTASPELSVILQRTSIPFHVAFDVAVVDAVVLPFQTLHVSEPDFL